MHGPPSAKPTLVIRAIYLALLAVAVPLLAWNGAVQQFNATLGDLLLRLRQPVPGGAAGNIVLVAIDDRTAARYGPLPLPRPLLAESLRRIAVLEPKVLAIDLLLAEPTPHDGELARALQLFPGVVLSSALESDPGAAGRWIMPLPALRGPGAAVGHVHASPDADGVVRSILLSKVAEKRRYWALGLETARLALGAGRSVESKEFLQLGPVRLPAPERDQRRLIINYAGPEGFYRRISLGSVLEGGVSRDTIRGKIVIVGVTAQGAGDRLFAPLSTGIGMSGIEIHANVTRTILDQAFLVPMSLPAEILAYMVLAAICVLGISALRGARLFLLLVLVAVTVPVASALALSGGRIWPLGSFLAVFLVAGGFTGLGEHAAVTIAFRQSERKRRDYAFRVQAIAHEIKTPLTAIQGSSELISDGTVPDAERAAMAGLIYKESKRLTGVLHAFLDVERMASGSLAIEKKPINLNAICDEVLERARLYATRKQIRIDAELGETTVPADAELLSFAVYNLLTNAVKYSPKQTVIRLGLAEDAKSVSVWVADRGYGIAPAEQERIFERFYRLHRDDRGAEEGNGIGLALVREIVTQHGGRILVDSQPGAGSRFTIVLPKG